jgi:hypothetical protein
MSDDIKYTPALITPDITTKLRQRASGIWHEISTRLLSEHRAATHPLPTTPDVIAHLERCSKGRPPVATFSELLSEKPERPPHIMPQGLAIALLAVSKLKDFPPTEVS